jgi:hypothetical protein
MFVPLLDRAYYFVRGVGSKIEFVRFSRCWDGSAWIRDSRTGLIFEHDPQAWREALHYLEEKGFVLVNEDTLLKQFGDGGTATQLE